MRSPIDLSERKDLTRLAELVAAIGSAWPDAEPLLVGATARDILLSYAHDIAIQRATFDVDFAVAVESWNEFAHLRQSLLDSGEFTQIPGIGHRLVFRRDSKLDLVPFGGLERADRTVAWPPRQDEVMHMLGYREALRGAVEVLLPNGVRVEAVSLPGLAVLKLFAWRDRRVRSQGKDAADLWTIVTNYLRAGNEDRLYAEFSHLAEQSNYDYSRAGAWMLGHDMRVLLHSESDDSSVSATLDLLAPELDPDGALLLVRDMRGSQAQEAFDLLAALEADLKDLRAP